MRRYEPSFRKVTFAEKVKAVAGSVGLSDPVVVQGMYIFKQPRIGTEGELCHGILIF